MTTLTQLRTVPSLLWQTLQLTGQHFLPLFLIGGLPMLLYTLTLMVLGHAVPPRPGLEPGEILNPALRNFFLWNLPNLLLLQPLSNGALVAAVVQLRRQEAVQPVAAFRTALQVWQRLLGALGLFWLINVVAALTLYGVFGRSEPPAWQSLGGVFMIAVAMAFLGYWWFRWSFLTQAVILGGCGPLQAWTRTRQLNAGAGWRLVGILIVLTVAGMLVLEVGLAKAGQWAEVRGSGLTNLLCMVGVTGVYWEVRGREEEAGA